MKQGMTQQEMDAEQEAARVTRLAELEKIKAARAERDKEAELWEQEKRRAENDAFSYQGWLEEERRFHLKQAKERAEIRLREGRPKPIDVLNKNLEVDLAYDFDMRQPFELLVGLSEPQLQELNGEIDMYVELMPEGAEFWKALKLLCTEQIAVVSGKRAPVPRDVLDVFQDQSLEGLRELKTSIAAQMEEGEDPEYWDALDKRCAVEIAKATLAQIHAEKLQQRLAQMDAKKREEERERLEALLRNKMERTKEGEAVSAAATVVAPAPGSSGAGGAAPAKPAAARRRQKLVLDEVEEMDDEEDDERNRQNERIRELVEEARQIDGMLNRGGGPERDEDFDGNKTGGGLLSEQDMIQMEMDRAPEENEELFVDEVETALQGGPAWGDKYAPRKPKYFNRVRTGYEWNKYNSTHYSAENPPPKVVHGYRFNIFYTDLVNATVTPTFRTEPIPGNSDWVILRFKAGPPYLDVAFKIVNKEWERDSKYGYKAVFERGVLRLYFNLRRQRYKR
jgi:hypothetical protein